jgi:4-amino-4-deoxy-L-arabinose transferase-like glycosyltransferase
MSGHIPLAGTPTAPPWRAPPWLLDGIACAWLAVLIVGLCRWSWRKWADLYIDFGRELYDPWQLADGKVLYRDIYLEYGPLSKYFNAGLFKVFGTSFQTLFLSNLVILAAFSVLLYRLIQEIAGRWAATVAVSVFLTVFAFSQYVEIANYNFVAPYSHEATHGVVLSFVLLFCLWRCACGFHWRWLAAAGLSAGAVLLTKPDLALAVGGAVAAFALHLIFDRAVSAPAKRRGGAAFVTGAALLPLAFFAYFLRHMPATEALKAVAGAWVPLFIGAQVGDRPFDRFVMGTDAPGANSARALAHSVCYALVLSGFLVVCRYLGRYEVRGRSKAAALVLGIGGAVSALVAAVALRLEWLEAFRPLPLMMVLVLLLSWALFVTGTASGWMTRPRLVIITCWAIFALLLLLKIILNARIYHYGFYLALPAALLLVVFAVATLGALVPQQARFTRLVWHTLLLALLVPCAANLLAISSDYYRAKRHAIGAGADRMLTYDTKVDGRAAFLDKMLAYCDQRLPPGATLTCLPEGIMVNYLLRRPNPSPAIGFGAGELSLWGEAHLLDTLRQHPPDYVMLIHRDHSEFGVGPFGKDRRNGMQIFRWVETEYRLLARVGALPFTTSKWGMALFERVAKESS